MKEQSRDKIIIITVLLGLLLIFFGGVPFFSVSVTHEVATDLPVPDNNDALEEFQPGPRLLRGWRRLKEKEAEKPESKKQKSKSKVEE